MSSPQRPKFLNQLRRSTRLAMLALFVFVLRIGMVAACAPADFSEFSGSGGGVDTHEVTTHADDMGDTPHLAGHCEHCACHHAATVAASPVLRVANARAPAVVTPSAVAHEAPFERALRPPIA